MLTLRCTKKLLKRLRAKPEETPAPSDALLGDWYANPISLPFRGKSVVLFVNEPTLLAVLVPGRGSKNTIPVFQERAARLLERIGLPEACVRHEAEAYADVQLLPTASRSVLGSMNDLSGALQWFAEDNGTADLDWDEIELNFSERIHEPTDYEHPRDVAMKLCAHHRETTAG